MTSEILSLNYEDDMDAARLEIYWNRLQAITDEADAALGRTAFSSVVREAHDYVTVLLDPQGRGIAQCTYSIPSFIGTLPITARHVLREFPIDTYVEGDVFITNDPWLGTGHLFDMCMITPIFYRETPVGLAGCVAHMTDVGGGGYSAAANSVYEEGICLPVVRLAHRGELNRDVIGILSKNVRVPDQVMGDIEAMMAANAVMVSRIREFLDEYGMVDLSQITSEIFQRSEAVMREAVRAVPDGTYEYELIADGYDDPLTVMTTVKVRGDSLLVDYSGSSPQSRWGLNSVMNYTYSYTNYGLKCLLDPHIPNNFGSTRPFSISAPEGCFLNALPPAPVAARNLAGHLLPSAVFGALADVLPDRVTADGGGAPTWSIAFSGEDDKGQPYSTISFFSGGQGGRSSADGLSGVHFPSNCANTPTELLEVKTPIRVVERGWAEDSAGAGQQRGGFGQRFVFTVMASKAMTVSLITDKLMYPARGVFGGEPGEAGLIRVVPDRSFHPKGNVQAYVGDQFILETPGGGGYGQPQNRERSMIEADLTLGLTSADYARRWFPHYDQT